jgi:hypothetical protein
VSILDNAKNGSYNFRFSYVLAEVWVQTFYYDAFQVTITTACFVTDTKHSTLIPFQPQGFEFAGKTKDLLQTKINSSNKNHARAQI